MSLFTSQTTARELIGTDSGVTKIFVITIIARKNEPSPNIASSRYKDVS